MLAQRHWAAALAVLLALVCLVAQVHGDCRNPGKFAGFCAGRATYDAYMEESKARLGTPSFQDLIARNLYDIHENDLKIELNQMAKMARANPSLSMLQMQAGAQLGARAAAAAADDTTQLHTAVRLLEEDEGDMDVFLQERSGFDIVETAHQLIAKSSKGGPPPYLDGVLKSPDPNKVEVDLVGASNATLPDESGASQKPDMTWETDVERAGSDYSSFDLPEPLPELCQAKCRADGRCRAWTYKKPGFAGPNARCFLKNNIPGAEMGKTCCISGVKNMGNSDKGMPFEADIDRPGSDIYVLTLDDPNPSICRDRCAEDARCKSYTFFKPGYEGPKARCHLKNTRPDPIIHKKCCVSGAKAQTINGGTTWEAATKRPGSDYSSFNLPKPRPELCQAQCARDFRCLAWTYVKPGYEGTAARCYLKNDFPAPQSGMACCVSGVKEKTGIKESMFYQSNTDLPGLDFDVFNLTSPKPENCEARCFNNPKCRAFTFVRPGVEGPQARCHLKSGIPSAVHRQSCCISATKNSAPQSDNMPAMTLEYDTDRPGMDYKGVSLGESNPELCKAQCAMDPICKAYAYMRPGIEGPRPRCYLKKGVPARQRGKEGVVSGVKQGAPQPAGLKEDPAELAVDEARKAAESATAAAIAATRLAATGCDKEPRLDAGKCLERFTDFLCAWYFRKCDANANPVPVCKDTCVEYGKACDVTVNCWPQFYSDDPKSCTSGRRNEV